MTEATRSSSSFTPKDYSLVSLSLLALTGGVALSVLGGLKLGGVINLRKIQSWTFVYVGTAMVGLPTVFLAIFCYAKRGPGIPLKIPPVFIQKWEAKPIEEEESSKAEGSSDEEMYEDAVKPPPIDSEPETGILPDDALILIFSFLVRRGDLLQSRAELGRCMLVNRRWYRVARENTLWLQHLSLPSLLPRGFKAYHACKTGLRAGHLTTTSSAAICLGGRRSGTLFTVSAKRIEVRMPNTGQLVQNLEGHTQPIKCMAATPLKLFSGDADGVIHARKATHPYDLEAIFQGHTGSITCLTYWKERVFSGSQDRTLRVWNQAGGNPLEILSGHEAPITCVGVLNYFIYTGSSDHTVRIWDMQKNYSQAHVIRYQAAVTCLALSSRKLYVGSLQTVYILNAETGEHWGMMTPGGNVQSLAVWGEQLYVGSSDCKIHIYDTNSDNRITSLNGHTQSVHHLAFGDNRLFSLSSNGQVHAWGYGVRTINTQVAPIQYLASRFTDS